ncbi:unnamed protein product [Citrullus colocynthis]|uniref:Uncharacterized protein n=1 Tax=Citrullus colocynthis TaxID=252529 RepID=A0ABP0Z4D0_9ROSI
MKEKKKIRSWNSISYKLVETPRGIALWRHYFQSTHCLIFVADSNDRGCVVEARYELHRMLNKLLGQWWTSGKKMQASQKKAMADQSRTN